VKVQFYGRLADAIGPGVELDAPAGCSVAELRQRLSEIHPIAAESLATSRALIGGSVMSDDCRLAADQTVEFLPPVSGG
jgi:molybdopterin converting factor small subunit